MSYKTNGMAINCHGWSFSGNKNSFIVGVFYVNPRTNKGAEQKWPTKLCRLISLKRQNKNNINKSFNLKY